MAHPDDEIIWCGGLMLSRPDWRWTVLSLSRADDGDRCPKFKSVCSLLGVTGHISLLDDSNPPKHIDCKRDIGKRILSCLGSGPVDLCVTHGANGEYGHLRHKQVHRQVLELVSKGLLVCSELWTFAYDCDAETGKCAPAAGADVLIELTDRQLEEKKRIIQREYGYGPNSFEVRACVTPEAFGSRKITIQEME